MIAIMGEPVAADSVMHFRAGHATNFNSSAVAIDRSNRE